MSNRFGEESPKKAALIVLGAVALIAAVAGIYLEQRSLAAASSLETARQRSSEVGELAAKYGELTNRSIEVSPSIDEARSTSYLSTALTRHGIAAPSINAGDPQSTQGDYDKIETGVNFYNARLGSIIELLRDVEENKSNLALTRAALLREGVADSWGVTLEYTALVRK